MVSRDSRGGSRTPGSGYGKRAGSAYSRSHHSPSSTEETAEETTETDSQVPADHRSNYSGQM